jgi:hypothetical protein
MRHHRNLQAFLPMQLPVIIIWRRFSEIVKDLPLPRPRITVQIWDDSREPLQESHIGNLLVRASPDLHGLAPRPLAPASPMFSCLHLRYARPRTLCVRWPPHSQPADAPPTFASPRRERRCGRSGTSRPPS